MHDNIIVASVENMEITSKLFQQLFDPVLWKPVCFMPFHQMAFCSHIVTRSDITQYCIQDHCNVARTQIFWTSNRLLSSRIQHKKPIACLLCLWCNPPMNSSYQPVCTLKLMSSIKFPIFPLQILITMDEIHTTLTCNHSLPISDNHQWLFLANCYGWYMGASWATDI